MEIGQRLAVIEPSAFRHEAVEQRQNAIGTIGEAAQDLVGINAGVFASLVEPGLGACGFLGGRQIEEGEEIARDEMRAGFLEIGLTLGLDQAGGRIGKCAVGIGRGF